jgi:AraC-like DNA-binding protein
MNELQTLISAAIDYRITWCEQHRAEPYHCDWRIDPCLVIISTLDAPYRLFVQDQGGTQCVEARKGQALLVPAGTLHRFEAPACEIRGINIQFSLFGGIDVLSFYQTPLLVSGAEAHAIRRSMEQLVAVIGRRSSLYPINDEQSQNSLDIGAVAQEHQLAFGLLSQVIKLSALQPHGNQRILLMQKLQPALQLVEEKLHTKLTVDQLARACDLSTHRFSTVFKQTLGDPPHRFILKRRLELAMSLLTHSANSVASIAEQLGFYDQPHFTKLFKAHTGLSPAFYRQDIQRRVMKGRKLRGRKAE